MPMSAKGLNKLMEELFELGQVAAKKAAYFDTDDHPDGAGSLKSRMEDEMGDVLAAIEFVAQAFELDKQKIDSRRDHKLSTFHRWHRNQTERHPINR